MFGKVNIKNHPPKVFVERLEEESEEFNVKFWKYWNEGIYYDIYNKIVEEEPVTLAIKRMSEDDLEALIKEKRIDFYEKDRKFCDYMCQLPHKDWKHAIREFNVYSKIYENDPGEAFSKSEYHQEREFIYFKETNRAVQTCSREKRHDFDQRPSIFNAMMYSIMKNEIENQ